MTKKPPQQAINETDVIARASSTTKFIGDREVPTCLVTDEGIVTSNEPLFLCKWNGESVVQIHTRRSLFTMYKDSGLYDAEEVSWYGGGNFNALLDHLSFTERDDCPSYDNETYENDNMTIQRIY